MVKKKLNYYKVEGEITEYIEYYIEAINKKEAIKKAENIEGTNFDDVEVEKVTKKEYEENK